MSKKIYVDAVHPEETRVVVVDTATGRVSDFDVETTTKPQIKGNIYLAKVIRPGKPSACPLKKQRLGVMRGVAEQHGKHVPGDCSCNPIIILMRGKHKKSAA